jgi:hypothetical protein
MKMRWWIVGTIAAVASGVLIFKHFAENKEKLLQSPQTDHEWNFGGSLTVSQESDFESSDFLV